MTRRKEHEALWRCWTCSAVAARSAARDRRIEPICPEVQRSGACTSGRLLQAQLQIHKGLVEEPSTLVNVLGQCPAPPSRRLEIAWVEGEADLPAVKVALKQYQMVREYFGER